MALKFAIALSLFGAIVSLMPASISTDQLLTSCAPTETQDSSSQQESPTTNRS